MLLPLQQAPTVLLSIRAACRLDFVGWVLKGFPFVALLASDAADEFSWRLRQATLARRDRRCGRAHDCAGTSEGRPRATVECADLARAFVFNDISNTLTNNARISTLLSIQFVVRLET